MKGQLLETWPREDGGGGGAAGGALPMERDRQKSTSGGDHNHLELRLGMSVTSYGGENIRNDAKVGAGAGAAGGGGGGTVFTATDHKNMLCCGGTSNIGLVVNQRAGGVGSQRWFSDAGAAGFVHPWSLAARQEKAVFEQTHLKANHHHHQPSSSTVSSRGPQPAAAVVGWPPVRTFRKNLASQRLSKLSMEEEEEGEGEEKEAKKPKPSEAEEPRRSKEEVAVVKKTMFVKVNMEGFAVGRKIDLMAHDGYKSLSRSVRQMFDNFLSVKYSKKGEGDEHEDTVSSNLVLLYEDNEGDRMLVGDVPWEMFVGSVKRLYITFRSKAHPQVEGEVAEKNENGD